MEPNFAYQGTFNSHRVVISGWCRALRRIVVDNIDTTDERASPVYHRKLSMHAPKSIPTQGQRADLGTKYEDPGTGIFEHCPEPRSKIARAKAVDDDMDRDTPGRRPSQGIANQAAGFVIGKDVGFEVNLAPGGVEGAH